jgi:hypothetical protein
LKKIEAAHETICQIHEDRLGNGAEPDVAMLAQFKVSDYILLNAEFLAEQSSAQETAELEGKDVFSDDEDGGGKGKGKRKGKGKAQGSQRGQITKRQVQGSLVAQLAIAYMNRSQHYHEAGLCDLSQHESWMPGHQGVSFQNGWCFDG